MPSITRGRSLATTAPTGSVGDESIPQAAQPPGLDPSKLPPRTLLRDTTSGRVGEFMAARHVGRHQRVWLRPSGGGLEWDILAEYIELADQAEPAS